MMYATSGGFVKHSESAAEIKRLRAVIKEADDYLNTNNLTNIASGSLMHQLFKDARLK
jgi:hypothetical protein